MKVYKFGGASVKDAAGVRNVVEVLRKMGRENTVMVVSAMGKTTNAMEAVIAAYFDDKSQLTAKFQEVEDYHFDILNDLFETQNHPIYDRVRSLFAEVQGFLAWNKSPKHAFVYDQVVGYGELISTSIVSAYLNEVGIANTWLDVRHYIKTDDNFRDAQVDWEQTQERIQEGLDAGRLYITQGFLGSDANNFTTTLGREGSDYSAAILAYCLNAHEVAIWKDVPGVLNADPRYFEDTQLLREISYREAIELAFYGASVIHPKTLQPLQRKEIPLRVKSFLNPEDPGTTVGKGKGILPQVPCFILKKDQVMLRLSSLDFAFIVENNISEIFKIFHEYRMKVDLIQNSAISFSVCMDNKFNNLEPLLERLRHKFKVVCYEGVSLYTIRHFDEAAIASLQNGRKVLLEQRGTETVQLVVNKS